MTVVVVMVDVTSKNTREHIHPQIMASLQQYSHIPSVLVLNKVSQWCNAHERESTLEGREGERDRDYFHSFPPLSKEREGDGWREREREREERERDSTYSHGFPPLSKEREGDGWREKREKETLHIHITSLPLPTFQVNQSLTHGVQNTLLTVCTLCNLYGHNTVDIITFPPPNVNFIFDQCCNIHTHTIFD